MTLPADSRRLYVQEDLAGPGSLHRRILHQDIVVRRHLEGRIRVSRRQRGECVVVHGRGRNQRGLRLRSRHGGGSGVEFVTQRSSRSDIRD